MIVNWGQFGEGSFVGWKNASALATQQKKGDETKRYIKRKQDYNNVTMMHHKVVIANSKLSNCGKSTSIRYVFEILSRRYTSHVIYPASGYDPAQDVCAIVEIPQSDGHIVKVGIESFGDPGWNRPKTSIDEFIRQDCEIMLLACHTKGTTVDYVRNLRSNYWQVIWFNNSTMKVDANANRTDASGTRLATQGIQLQDRLSRDYGLYVASLIERLVLTEGVI